MAPPVAEPPKTGLRGKLQNLQATLGNAKILAKITPASWSPARKGGALLALALAVVAAAVAYSFLFLRTGAEDDSQSQAALNSALDGAWNWVDGSEAAPIFTKPPWLADLQTAGARGQTLAAGIEAFLDFRFEEALTAFESLQDPASPDPRLLSLIAATDLRLLNYGQAKANYSQALALSGQPAEKGGLKEASDRLGLALALFHQQDYENGLNEAGISWRIRNKELGPADSKTLAAVNSMATSLMALSRSAVAGDLLLEAVGQAIEAGADQTQPVMRDSLSILFLAFEDQGRGEELRALFQPPEAPPAAPGDAPAPTPGQATEVASAEPDTSSGPASGPVSGPEASPSAGQTDQLPPLPEPPPPVAPADLTVPASPFDREAAREIAAHLKANHPNSKVLPALSMAMAANLTGGAQPTCRGPYPPEAFAELLSLCLDVAKGYASINELQPSADILTDLTKTGLSALAEKTDLPKPRLIDALALLSSERLELDDPAGAEAALRQAREVAATMPGTERQTRTSLFVLSLRLSELLLNQNRAPVEAEMELVAGLTAAKKLVSGKTVDSHPLAPVLYLRLAWLVGAMGRSKEANSYRSQAERSLKAVTKAHPEYASATDQMAQAHAASRQGKANTDTLAHLWRPVLPANRPPQPPASPEVMRVELSALKLLNRLPEFATIID
ncbi:MAG: hypothetical protein LBJ61_02735, partial [Deltaproteobacteria bacterium]|nr:hypothetical protein [Deltaproteobacteria bacterium]